MIKLYMSRHGALYIKTLHKVEYFNEFHNKWMESVIYTTNNIHNNKKYSLYSIALTYIGSL